MRIILSICPFRCHSFTLEQETRDGGGQGVGIRMQSPRRNHLRTEEDKTHEQLRKLCQRAREKGKFGRFQDPRRQTFPLECAIKSALLHLLIAHRTSWQSQISRPTEQSFPPKPPALVYLLQSQFPRYFTPSATHTQPAPRKAGHALFGK